MPVTGLPYGLEIILEQLIMKDDMQSWQIYEQKNGAVCVKLRFTGKPKSDANQSCMEQSHTMASYRKISDKQMARNRKRAQEFKNKDVIIADHGDGVTTRSKSKKEEDIEQPRGLDIVTGMINDPHSILSSPPSMEHSTINNSFTPVTSHVNTCSTPCDNSDSLPQDSTSCKSDNSDDHVTPTIPRSDKLNIPTCDMSSAQSDQQQSTDFPIVCHYLKNGRPHGDQFYPCKGCGVFICTFCLMAAGCHRECRFKQIDRTKSYK